MIIFVKHIGALRNSANIDEVRTMTLVHVIPHDKYSKIPIVRSILAVGHLSLLLVYIYIYIGYREKEMVIM
jgi:hypothetical protein